MTTDGDAIIPLPEDPVATVSRMSEALRERGVPVGPDRVVEAVTAMALLGPAELEHVYWAGRASLCSEPAHLEIYDSIFWSWGRSRTAVSTPGLVPDEPVTAGEVHSAFGLPVWDASAAEGAAFGGASSGPKPPGRRDLAELSEAERADVLALIASLRPRALRSGRRRRAGGHVPDVAKTVDTTFRNGGEVVAIARERNRTRPRRLVVIVDVSESVAEYADYLLRFGYAAVRAAPSTTEVFSVGTSLTRVTRQLRYRVPARAFAAAGEVIVDWHGGTRLGEGLAGFLDAWGRRGAARGAVVVICSDGDSDDVTELTESMRRLARLAHAVIWANPCLGRPGYRPNAPGLRATKPYVTRSVPAGSMAALSELAGLVANPFGVTG